MDSGILRYIAGYSPHPDFGDTLSNFRSRVALSSRYPALWPKPGPLLRALIFFGTDYSEPIPVDRGSWHESLPMIVNHRLAGVALRAAQIAEVPLDQTHRRILEQAATRETAATLAHAAATGPIVRTLDRAGLRALVIKGPGVALRLEEPNLRPYFDIDILVAPTDADRALGLLAELGYQLVLENIPRHYYLRHCKESVNLRGDHGLSVDLHRRLAPWVWGDRLAFDLLWDSSEVLTVAGSPVRVPSLPHTVLIVLLHLFSDKGRPGASLGVWYDLVHLLQVQPLITFADEADRSGLDFLLEAAINATPMTASIQHRRNHPAPLRDRARMRLMLTRLAMAHPRINELIRLPLHRALIALPAHALPAKIYRARGHRGDRRPRG